MKLISKIISELGGDEAHAITLCPKELAYVCELTEEKIVLMCGKNCITVEGENLSADEYFQGDFIVRGVVSRVSVE